MGSDPYVRVSLQKGEEVFGEMKTACKTDELDPVWDDEKFSFAHAHALDAELVFKVEDSDIGRDQEIGQARIPVKIIPFVDEHIEFTFSLGIHNKKELGTITVALGVCLSLVSSGEVAAS